MYLEHYGLREPPFSITPDPRFVFLSERHRDALAHLLFGIGQGGSGGFVQLTGEVGTGKTTLCRLLLEQLPDNARVALVLNPRLTPVELLETICEELHLEGRHLEGRHLDRRHLEGGRLELADDAPGHGSIKARVDALNAYLLDAYARGLRVVLIVDEAQNLSIDALEQVRLLTNLETDTQKLLQIVLLGQPELRAMLARDDLRQLAQRITARFHLTPLDRAETAAYLRHRYAVAGGLHFPFTPAALRRLHAHSGGVPRLLNVIADRSLLAGYARDRTRLGPGLVDRAAGVVLAPRPRRAWHRRAAIAAAVLATVLATVLLAPGWRPSPPAAAQAAQVRAQPPVAKPVIASPAVAKPVVAKPVAANPVPATAAATPIASIPPTPDFKHLPLPLPADIDGDAGAWLRARLGIAATDVPSAEDVRRFQRAHGLIEDGLIGPKTLLTLVTGSDAPPPRPTGD